jgi:hypothetical protein
MFIYNKEMDIFNRKTNRWNKSTTIAKALREGTLTINDINIPTGYAWTGERFNKEKTIKLKLKKGTIKPTEMAMSRDRLYNQVSGRFIQDNPANRVIVNRVNRMVAGRTLGGAVINRFRRKQDAQNVRYTQIKKRIGALTGGESFEVKMSDVKSPRDLLEFFGEGANRGKFIIRFEDGRVRTLSADVIDELIELLEDQVVVSYPDTKTEIVELLRGNDIGIFERLPDKAVKPNGGFFPYFHKLASCNLERYDIYTDFKGKKNLDENCLIVALRNSGVVPELIDTAKVLFRSAFIPKTRLGEVADKCKICISVKSETNKKQFEVYGDKTKPMVKIGIIENHYFLIEDTPYTQYAIKNYWTMNEFEFFKKMYDGEEGGHYWGDAYARDTRNNKLKFSKTRPRMNSYNLIEYLVENKKECLMDLSEAQSKVETTPYYKKIKSITNLEYQEPYQNDKGKWFGDVIPTDYHSKDPKEIAGIIFYDVETCSMKKDAQDEWEGEFKKFWAKKKNEDATIHKLYQLCYTEWDEKYIHTLNETDTKDIPKKMMNKLTDKYGKTQEQVLATYENPPKGDKWKKKIPRVILYAHNGGYDLRFIRQYLWDFTIIQNGNSLICGEGNYLNGKKWVKLEFRDTYRLISKPLSAFGNMFKLPMAKEYMPYHLYNTKNLWERGAMLPIDEVLEEIPASKRTRFDDCLVASGALQDGMFDMVMYSKYYCKRDVEVMREGFKIFRGWVLDALDIDTLQFYTIPSIAHEYFMATGCYDGTYELRGVVREFISRALVGGRCMLCENTKQFVEGKIADFDAVSLYPSAMKAMDGFLMGMPNVIKDGDDWENASGYFVELKITDITKHRKFPMMSYINPKTGTRTFSDDVSKYEDTIIVDKIMLNIWKEYHGVSYELIRGYMFNDGHNPQIKETIEEVFNERLKAKAQGNPIQEVWKLVMNSGYGKSITKPHDEKEIYKDEDEYLNHIARYYNWVKQANPILSAHKKQMWCIKEIDPISQHGNYAHIGIEILAQSKRIMADVMYLAEDNNINLYYTDTDSIHMDLGDVEKLGELFKNKFSRELIGKGMGQFHTDFELSGCKDVYSKRFIALGKKCYLDELVGIDKETGEEKTGFHIRMKGVKDSAIKRVALDDNKNLIDIYTDLYSGKEYSFDLCKGVDGKEKIDLPAFEYHNSWLITNKREFVRKVKF